MRDVRRQTTYSFGPEPVLIDIFGLQHSCALVDPDCTLMIEYEEGDRECMERKIEVMRSVEKRGTVKPAQISWSSLPGHLGP